MYPRLAPNSPSSCLSLHTCSVLSKSEPCLSNAMVQDGFPFSSLLSGAGVGGRPELNS